MRFTSERCASQQCSAESSFLAKDQQGLLTKNISENIRLLCIFLFIRKIEKSLWTSNRFGPMPFTQRILTKPQHSSPWLD